MAARAPPPSPDAISAANAAAAAFVQSAPVSTESNEPLNALMHSLEDEQSSELDDMWSACSNPSVSSYSSSTREMHRHVIASAFFGPISNATAAIIETDEERESQRSAGSIKSSGRGDWQRQRPGDATTPTNGLLRRVFRRSKTSELGAEPDAIEQEQERKRRLRNQLSVPLDSPNRDNETPEERHRRKENRSLFEELVHLANTRQPVQFERFKQRRSKSQSGSLRQSIAHDGNDFGSSSEEEEECGEKGGDEMLNTELLEAYIAYSKSIGHEPNIQLNSATIPHTSHSQLGGGGNDYKSEEEQHRTRSVSYIHDRPVLKEREHLWTGFLGTRHSKRRGCVQFWMWLLIGVGVLLWLGLSLSSLQLNEVLHLDAFTGENVQVTDDYTFLHLLDEVDFHFTYTIETPGSALNSSAKTNASYFNALLLDENEYENYVNGESFRYIEAGTILRATYAHLPRTYIENTIKESMYFVLQPCYLKRNPLADYCQSGHLPTSVSSREKIYDLDENKRPMAGHFNVTYVSVNPMPVACSSSGWLGGSYLLLFLPYLIITLFGLRVFQMILYCESWQKNLERVYSRELQVPESEVDYWQPMPWDRKVPKTRLCGPCCWTKFRRPFEPFYTWWRHENYFTWIFFPYRNEQLSRGERALIVVCSLYVTFYVLFIIVMLRDSWGADMTIFTSVVLYAILISVLPSAGKAVFKELFKLIFRQRRKYYRAKAAGGDPKGFSFRLAFLLQFLVVVLLTLAQTPIYYIWAYRSCLFLQKFMYFGALAAIMRMSLVGLAIDLAWYLIIKTWGWKDLCPYCTERIKHCDCFNDELLVLAVERVGTKWELIRVLDDVMAKQHHYDPQFKLYTAEQLRERWEVIVERAEAHMEKMEKLCAYQEKKRLDALRHDHIRRSLTSFLSLRGTTQVDEPGKLGASEDGDPTQRSTLEVGDTGSSTDETGYRDSDENFHMCSLREIKILELNSKIKLDKFEKHYDSNISEVFHLLTQSVQKLRHHGKRKHESRSRSKDANLEQIPEEGAYSDSDSESSKLERSGSGSRRREGETMWVFDTPAQRLKRRQEEKLQRKRAFRVLNNYKIESVDPNPESKTPSSPLVSPCLSRQGSASAFSSVLALSTSQGHQHDTKLRPLLSAQSQSNTARSDDLVVLMSDEHKGSINRKVNLDEIATERVEDDYDDDDEYPNDLECGIQQPPSSALLLPPQSQPRVYSITERPQTLYRRVSASASAFAAWALNYDPNAKY